MIDQPLTARVLRIARGEHEGRSAGLFEHHAGSRFRQHEVPVHLVGVGPVSRDELDRRAGADPIEVQERMQVRRAVAGDPHPARAVPRIGGVRIVRGALFQRLRPSVRAIRVIVRALHHDEVDVDRGDHDGGVGLPGEISLLLPGRRRPLNERLELGPELILSVRRLETRSPQEPGRVAGESGRRHETAEAEGSDHGADRRSILHAVTVTGRPDTDICRRSRSEPSWPVSSRARASIVA